MTRGLGWSDVREILDELGVRYESGAYGFTVRAPALHGIRRAADDWRVRCGSGIAGRGRHWTIVAVRSGESLSGGAASTRAELRRALREHLAGPHPDPDHRESYYATRHRTRVQSGHYIWKRKKRAPSKFIQSRSA